MVDTGTVTQIKTVFWVDTLFGDYNVMSGTAKPTDWGFQATPHGGGTPRFVGMVFDTKARTIAEKDRLIDIEIARLRRKKG